MVFKVHSQFVGYPRTAVGLIPMAVPGPIENSDFISLNESSLRVDFSLPPQRVEGFNGSPVDKIKVEIARGKKEV